MKTADFTTTLLVDQTPEQVYQAINNVRGWWQGAIEGITDQQGETFTYRMKEFHYSKQKIETLVPNQKVVWLVTDGTLSFTQRKNEWVGTRIVFEIDSIGDKTQLRFTHEGLVPALECFGNCSKGWTNLIQESLRSLIENGEGVDVFG